MFGCHHLNRKLAHWSEKLNIDMLGTLTNYFTNNELQQVPDIGVVTTESLYHPFIRCIE